MLTCRLDDPDETAEGQEETALSEGGLRRLDNAMRIVVERRAKEAKSALAGQRFAQAERRLEPRRWR